MLDIGVLWEGYGDDCTQMELYMWDNLRNGWGDGAGGLSENRFMDNFAGNRDAELIGHIEATIRHETNGGVIMPMISPGFTDSRIYRKHGVPAIGYVPTLITTEEVGGVHGHDERISTANLRLGTQLLLDSVRRIAGTP